MKAVRCMCTLGLLVLAVVVVATVLGVFHNEVVASMLFGVIFVAMIVLDKHDASKHFRPLFVPTPPDQEES